MAGFFPECAVDDFPQQSRRVGIREMGLPYESDPAITRHLAYFLHRHAMSAKGRRLYPSAVLFNGGVMKAGSLRNRVLHVLRNWSGDPELVELKAVDLDQSVALGAAYYGLARQGEGLRIRAGTSRAYYIGVESSMPAVPGIPTPVNALCVVPFGMEEGTEAEIRPRFRPGCGRAGRVSTAAPPPSQRTIRPATSSKIGPAISRRSPPWRRLLPATDEEGGGTLVPVWLESRVTEIGTLELWCVARDSDRRWKLEFNIRDGRRATTKKSRARILPIPTLPWPVGSRASAP